MSDGWTEIGAIAGIAVALGTLTLAGFTYVLARRTSELAAKAQDQVNASMLEARATESLALEARTDRQLAWRPQLELKDFGRIDETWCFTVRNSGAGPALDVVGVARDISNTSIWTIIRFGDLRPGDRVELIGDNWKFGGSVDSLFEGVGGLDERHAVSVSLMCGDVLGHRMRFGIADPIRPYPGEVSKVLPPEIVGPGDRDDSRSRWASEPIVWG